MALCSYSSASTSISSKLSVSSSSLDNSFRILLQAKAAAMQSWLWVPRGSHREALDGPALGPPTRCHPR